MPAEFTRCVAALKKEGKSDEQAYAICTAQFERRHKGKTPQSVAKEMAEEFTQFSVLADEAAAKLSGERLHDFVQNYFCATAQAITINSVDRKTREIEGYASYYNEPMRNGMIMAPGCFSQATIDLFMTNPVLLRNHDPNRVIGVVLKLENDDKGLICRARVDDAETWDDIVAGRVRAFSWAGLIEQSVPVKDVRNGAPADAVVDMVTAAALMEMSIATIPNSPQSLFSIAKAHNGVSGVSLWAPVRRVNASERMVYGYATVFNVPDADGHVMTKAAVEKAVGEYKGWANVREMHWDKAVGKAPVLEVDDYGLWVGVYVSQGAEDCWQKILDRTYQGFSIGGSANADTCTRGTLPEYPDKTFLFLNDVQIDEITICDRPKVAQATFVFVKRQDENTLTSSDAGVVSWKPGFEICSNGSVWGMNDVSKPPGAADADDKGGPPVDAIPKAQQAGLLQGFMTLMSSFFSGDSGGTHAGTDNPPADALPTANTGVPNTQNRAMTKETEAALAQLRSEMEATQKAQNERLDAILAAVKPADPPAEGATDSSDDAQNAAGDMPPWMKDKKKKMGDMKGDSAKCAVSPEFVTAFEAKVAEGAKPVDAYNAVLEEMAGDDAEKALVLLGLVEPKSEGNSGVTPEQIAQIVNSAVASQIKPLREDLETVKNSAMRNTRGRLSTSVVPDTQNGSTAEPSMWGNIIPQNVRR